MKTALFYLLEIVLCSGLLYSYYHFFLRNKRFHQYNRYYLLLATVISILIPFLDIPVYFDAQEAQPVLAKTLIAFSPGGFEEETAAAGNTIVKQAWFTWTTLFSSLYLLFALVLFTRFIMALLRIARLVNIYPGEKIDNIHFVNTNEPSTPFSFFRWLFWNNKIELNSDHGQQIFRHELFHIRQKHSWDIIFLEIISVIFWLNPFFHLVKKEIKAIHEFLADKFAVEENKEWDYAELLLMQVLGSPNTRLTNPFFHNQIKRRIAMLTTSKKSGFQYLRKLMVLPLAAILISLFAFTYKANKVKKGSIWFEKPITIVVDAGHGGNDPGAWSNDRKNSEAELSLAIAQQIKKLAKDYNITVVMTRENDHFPGNAVDNNQATKNRVEIAANAKPDAFISIHLNAAIGENESSGFEAYISAQKENHKENLLAASILNTLEPICDVSRGIKQRKKAGIFVLDKATYPSLILQCGFITNKKDLEFITNETNREKIARGILEGIINYKNALAEKAEVLPAKDTIPAKLFKGVFFDTKKNMAFEADTIHFVTSAEKTQTKIEKALLIVNGSEVSNDIFLKKTILSKKLTFYDINDKTAIDLYGQKAKKGVIVFEGATIIDTPTQKYYENVFTDKHASTPDTDNKIFEKLEIEPAFPGGNTEWEKYLAKQIDANLPAEKGAPAGNYTIFVRFIVDKDGNIKNIEPLTKHGYSMEEQLIDAIKKGPHWLPGIQNGFKVNAYKKQQFTFIVPAKKGRAAVEPTNTELDEVVVTGYPSKKQINKDEIVVTGRPAINKSKEENEVITVVGYSKYPSRDTTQKKN